MDKVAYVGEVKGGKVWGCSGGNVWGTVTKVSREIMYNDGSRRTGWSDDLERSGLLRETGLVDVGSWRNRRVGVWSEVCCVDRTATLPRLNLPRQTK